MAPTVKLSRRLAGSGRNCPCRGAGLRLLATAPAIGQLSLSRDQWSGALPTLGVQTSAARGIRIGGFGVSATGVAAAGSVFRNTALSLVMEDVFRWVSLRWSEGASRAESRPGRLRPGPSAGLSPQRLPLGVRPPCLRHGGGLRVAGVESGLQAAADCRCVGRDLGQFAGRPFWAVGSDSRLYGELPLNRRPAPKSPKLVWWKFRRKFQSLLIKMLVNSGKNLLFLAYLLCWGKKLKLFFMKKCLLSEPFVSICKQIKFPHWSLFFVCFCFCLKWLTSLWCKTIFKNC